MAYSFSISSLKPGKKRFFGQDIISMEIEISVFRNLFKDFYVSRLSAADVKLIYSGDIFNLRLSQVEEIRIGLENKSFTGVYLSHKNERFTITMNKMANQYDWYVFGKLIDYFDSITTDNFIDSSGNIVDIKKLIDNYYSKIEQAHNDVLNLDLAEDVITSLNGIKGPVYLNKKIISEFRDFTALLNNLIYSQWNESFIATPMRFVIEDTYFVEAYTLTSDLLTTLPKESVIDDNFSTNLNLENNIKIIQLYDQQNRRMLSKHYFSDFFDALDEREYSYVDAANVKLILTLERFKQLSTSLKKFELSTFSN